MSDINFYSLDQQDRRMMLESAIGDGGKCTSVTSGMCGEIYVFGLGANVKPSTFCAKVPKQLASCSAEDTATRFVRELEKQLSFYHHMFVHWAFDFKEVMGVPVALFRYWGSDLDQLLKSSGTSEIQKLSIMVYICSGLKHCYKKGLIAHQDLKPANIFLRDIKEQFGNLPDLDIYNFAIVADFGLSNASTDSGIFDGTRPYMAPEQWDKTELSAYTDVFALGVILYELMTDGYHPVGIRLQDFWPQPKNGNTKKWTKQKDWIKWKNGGCKIECPDAQLDPELLSLAKCMISVDPKGRPSIDEVIESLLKLIQARCQESYTQVKFLINYFNKQASSESLDKKWPYLSEVWKGFKARFDKNI
jgi:serine/threonine protein kinase